MDKKELRQDPIREKILLFLSYIENNRKALYGIIASVVAIILIGSYISTSSKNLNEKSSLTFGKAINNSIAGDKETSIALFKELLNSIISFVLPFICIAILYNWFFMMPKGLGQD